MLPSNIIRAPQPPTIGASPSDQPPPPSPTELQWLALIDSFYREALTQRQAHEGVWYVNAAMFRGNQTAVWLDSRRMLVTIPGVAKASRVTNIVQQKSLARASKFLRQGSKPEVRPASPDIQRRLDARATTKALAFQDRRLNLKQRYHEALMWSVLSGHGYWWIYWNPSAPARVMAPEIGENPDGTEVIGDPIEQQLSVGDVAIEVGSPFELLPRDPTLVNLADQPSILRIKRRLLSDVKRRYGAKAAYVKADSSPDEAHRYLEQLGSLSSLGLSGIPTSYSANRSGMERYGDARGPESVIVKEYFEKATPDFPKGRYAVVAGGMLLVSRDELPYAFEDFENPYPVVDFPDLLMPGQYWCPTIAEQLVDPQRQLNRLETQLDKVIELMSKPKWLIARSHNIAKGALTSAVGEVVEYTPVPNVDKPFQVQPANIASDVWNRINLLYREIDIISQIFPETMGQTGSAESGYQTSLLQEASDQIFGPIIAIHDRAKEDAYRKIRRLMQKRYTLPRLLAVSGRDYEAEMVVFQAEQIDEFADVIIEPGSILPDLKGARIQAVTELFQSGMLGDPQNPDTQRMARSMLEFGTKEDALDDVRREEERARIENLQLNNGAQVEPALWCDDHRIHYRIHTLDLKSAEAKDDAPAIRQAKILHLLAHVRWIDPPQAMLIAAEYGLPPPPPPGGVPPPPPAPSAAPGAEGGPPDPMAAPSPASPPPMVPPPIDASQAPPQPAF